DRISQLTETTGDTTRVLAFAYDSVGRLQEVRRDGVLTATYEYDLNGNRTHLTTPGGAVTGTYDAQDRLTSYGTASYTYGSNGEIKSKTDGGDTTSYTYDALGNLTAVMLPDATQITYVIDGQNRRVGKRVNGVLVQGFLYQGQLSPVAELGGSQQIVSRFVYGTRANVPDYMIKGGSTYRLISDHLGSVRLVVDTADGSIAQRIDYDEFGRVTRNTAPGFQPFGYAGGIVDSHTGYVRFGARDYDPATGRWTAKDPIGFGGADPNLYTYAQNDPLNYSDPSGLWTPINGGGIFFGGGLDIGGRDGGLGGQVSGGIGLFGGDGISGPSIGTFAAAGGAVGNEGRWYGLDPDNPGAGASGSEVSGASLGAGPGIFFTNAESAEALRGPFDTRTYSVLLFSLQFATDGTISYGSFSLGHVGLGYSRYTVNTYKARDFRLSRLCPVRWR
ncbi:MAG TPA: RHS repeat-associated core domain-containing protein, partial [Gemmatimonadales bacterium]|nr:RHS repeat-associated core domain-containing protein [Gemmatimonadales bacterium]